MLDERKVDLVTLSSLLEPVLLCQDVNATPNDLGESLDVVVVCFDSCSGEEEEADN